MSAKQKTFVESLGLLRPGSFRRYIIGSAISDTGTWMQMMAQSWVMSDLTSRALVLGLVTFFTGLPTIGLAPIGGSVADRFDKRTILIASQVAQMVLAIAFGFLVLTHRIQIWEIMVFGALLGVTIAFEMPAMSALVPELVKREEIAAAVGLDRTVFHGSRLVGSSIGGLIIKAVGAAPAFFQQCEYTDRVPRVQCRRLVLRSRGRAVRRRSGYRHERSLSLHPSPAYAGRTISYA